jgi:hypothetical protein
MCIGGVVGGTMDEARTLSLLAWTIGIIVGVLFILDAIALSLS